MTGPGLTSTTSIYNWVKHTKRWVSDARQHWWFRTVPESRAPKGEQLEAGVREGEAYAGFTVSDGGKDQSWGGCNVQRRVPDKLRCPEKGLPKEGQSQVRLWASTRMRACRALRGPSKEQLWGAVSLRGALEAARAEDRHRHSQSRDGGHSTEAPQGPHGKPCQGQG